VPSFSAFSIGLIKAADGDGLFPGWGFWVNPVKLVANAIDKTKTNRDKHLP
jgi:hypothetical protein